MAFGLSMLFLLCACNGRKRGERPNVLLVVLDTARADRFSFMGYERKTSPHIDELAEGGAVFSRTFATAFWTLPSHASLFTGLHPSQAGATSESNHLPDSGRILAEILRSHGYDTAAFVCNPWISLERGFGRGFDQFKEMWRKPAQMKWRLRQGDMEKAAVKNVLAWFEKQRSRDEPFFVFVNLNCAHMPYWPPEPHRSAFLKSGSDPERVEELGRIRSMWSHLAGELKLDEADLRVMNDLYDGEIAFADECVGEIVGRLRSDGVLDETMVIVTSDHGENLGDHGMIDHLLSMYDTTLHVPLVVRYPERFEPRTVDERLASLVDIAPTVLEVCGLKDTIGTGESLCRDDHERVFVTAENERPLNAVRLMKEKYPAFDVSSIDRPVRAIRTDRHKLIWEEGKKAELFDLRRDPSEQNDIALEEEEKRKQLYNLLKGWADSAFSSEKPPSFQSRDEDALEALRALGYAER